MKLSEVMEGLVIDPNFKGTIPNDTDILAIDPSEDGTSEIGEYIVARQSITAFGRNLNPVTSDKNYYSGAQTTKTGTKLSYSMTGDVYVGDEFIDLLMSYGIKYGTGKSIERKYVYFNSVTGKGDTGVLTLVVNEDTANGPQEDKGFTATLTAVGTPKEYNHTAATALNVSKPTVK